MNIGISLNHKYVKYAYVMLTSLFVNNKEEDIIVYAMEADLTDEDKNVLQNLATQYHQNLICVHVDISDYVDELPTTSEWSVETYFRLQMSDLLPLSVERLLYIDIDVIVNKSISNLYESDFEEALFVVCPDAVSHIPFGDVRDALFAEIQDKMCYFNAGVMLWNLKQLRLEQYDFQYYLNLARELNYQILAPDQDLLNYAHWDRLRYVDANQYDFYARIGHSCGVTYEEVKQAVSIVHYVGYKPWSGEFWNYDIEQLWWDYAKKTPYYVELLEDFLHSSLYTDTMEVSLETLLKQKQELLEGMQKTTAIIKQLTGQ